ncbi:MAG: hypothetical protein AAF960_06450 [Bacteroidota bacterium]
MYSKRDGKFYSSSGISDKPARLYHAGGSELQTYPSSSSLGKSAVGTLYR